MKARLTQVLVGFVVLSTVLLGEAQKPLNNSDVVQMVKAGFRESLIRKAIEANETAFDVSPQALIELKNAGVSQDIIELMLDETPVGYRDTPSRGGDSKQNPPVIAPTPADSQSKTPAERPSPPGNDVKAPQVIYKVDAEYTDQARKAKLQGTVVLNLVVQKDGTVRDIRVIQPLGLGLDEKAIEAVKQWRFRPGLKSGQAVNVAAVIEVTFRLLDDPKPQAAETKATVPVVIRRPPPKPTAPTPALEPQPLQPWQYPPATVKGVKGGRVVLVNYVGLPDEPMVQLLEKARNSTNAMPGVIVAVTPPGDDRVSFANPADIVSECTLRPCSKDEIPKAREFATNGGYIVIRLVKQGSGLSTAETFFRVAVHEFRHVKDLQDSKRRAFPHEWSRSRKTPHDDRPEEIRANKTVEDVMKKLRERRDAEWEQMLTRAC